VRLVDPRAVEDQVRSLGARNIGFRIAQRSGEFAYGFVEPCTSRVHDVLGAYRGGFAALIVIDHKASIRGRDFSMVEGDAVRRRIHSIEHKLDVGLLQAIECGPVRSVTKRPGTAEAGFMKDDRSRAMTRSCLLMGLYVAMGTPVHAPPRHELAKPIPLCAAAYSRVSPIVQRTRGLRLLAD